MMHARRKLLAFGAAACLCSSAASAARPGADDSVLRAELPGGLTILVRPNHNSNVVGMELVSRIGTRYEAAGHAGLDTLTLRMAMDGVPGRSGDAVREWFEDRGAMVETKAHPDFSEISAAVSAEDWQGMAQLIADCSRSALLSLDSFAQERRTLLQQVSTPNSDAEAAAYASLRSLLSDDTAYGRPEDGFPETVSRLTPEDVSRFYHALFSRPELVVSVSGNVDGPKALHFLRGLFAAGLPAMHVTPAPPPPHPSTVSRNLVTAGSGAEAWILVGYRAPGVASADYATASVLNAMLGGSNSGSLTSLFRDRNGVYDSGSFLQPFATEGQIVGYVRADPLLWDNAQGKTRPVIDELTKQLLGVFQGVSERGASPDALRTARAYVVGQYLQSRAHNRAYAGYLAWYEAIGRGAAYDQQFLALVQKVTPQDVTRLARTLFKPGAEAVVVTLPRPRADD